MKILKKQWLAAFALAFLAGRADAGLIPQTVGTATAGADTTSTIGVLLQSNSSLKSGDFFTIYDVQGYVSGSSVMPSNWTMTMQNSGITPAGLTVPGDNSSLPNLTFTYSGPTVSGSATASLGVGNFVITTTQALGSNPFAGLSQLSNGNNEAVLTELPSTGGGANPSGGGPNGGGSPGLPEPASLILVALGLPLAGLVGGLRRRASA
jgi:hypothetical protein